MGVHLFVKLFFESSEKLLYALLITHLPTAGPEPNMVQGRQGFQKMIEQIFGDFWIFLEISFLGILLIFPHRLIMLFDTRREIVGPVVLGDEVEVGDRSRVEGGMDGVFSWVTDG